MIFRPLFKLLLLLITALSLSHYLSHYAFVFELVSHFQILWMSLLLVGLVMTWLLAWSKWCWLMVVVLGINTYSVLIWYVPDKVPPTARESLKVLLFNQGLYSTRSAEIVQTIDEYQPDLIMIQEINLQTAKALNALTAYPYRVRNLRNDSRDMALWSRYPLTGVKKDVVSPQSMTSIYGQLHLPQHTVPLLLVHTSSANHLHTFQLRKQEWQQMAQFVNRYPSKSWVVLGDMNTTMWSELYRGFISHTGLHNSRKGFGLLPTWPTIYSGWHGPPILQTVLNPLPGMLKRLPIDHCLVGPAVYTQKTWVVTQRELASDHFPLWIELIL
jgi:endonuclease/exonuclease/phosphatase (EEP) superfamily protein YafD